jgi:hypothetical protein
VVVMVPPSNGDLCTPFTKADMASHELFRPLKGMGLN